MSVQVNAEFTQMLQALMSTNNTLRKAAEQHFQQQCEQNPQHMLFLLLSSFGQHQTDAVLRIFAAVLLRRATEKYLDTLDDHTQEQFRQQLLYCWIHHEHHNIQCIHKLAHVIGQVCMKTEWVDLIPKVLQHAAAHPQHATIPVMSLLEILAEYSPMDITTHYQSIGEFTSHFFVHENGQLRMHCAKAVVACIAAFEDDVARNAFKPAVTPILNILTTALQQGDESDATHLIDHLVTVAQMQPMFFKASFDVLVNAMLAVGNNEHFEFSTRTMALEMLITICESAPALARRSVNFVENLVRMVMKMMLEVDEDEDGWKRQKYGDDDFDEDAEAGDEAIERIASGLGGKSVTDVILAHVQRYAQHAEWKYRRAAVAAVCRLAEGASKFFGKHIEGIISFLVTCLQDRSVRVQYEAIQTIGRIAAVFSDSCDLFINSYLPLLAVLLQNAENCPRIRGHAASAMINMLHPEHCDASTLEKFVQPLLQSLLVCLQGASYEVRAPCLVVVGCVAQVCPAAFAHFYDQFMPGIKSILTEAIAPEFMELRGKAMECAGLIGEAVGPERFAADALDIMRIFLHAMHHDAERDITFEYILPASARISKALNAQFVEFLPIVFEPLLQGANQEVKFSMEDADDDDVEGEVTHDDDAGTQSTVITLAAGVRKKVSLNTHAVQQKTQAARILYEFATSLGPLLGSYLLPSIETLINMVTDKHSNDIRSNASLALTKMFTALLTYLRVNPATVCDVHAVFTACISKLVDGLKVEPDATTRTCQAECIRDIFSGVYALGREEDDGTRRGGYPVTVSETLSYQVVTCVLLQSAECVLRRNQKEDAINQNEALDVEDRDAQQEEIEEEDELLTVLIDVIGHLLKLQGEPFMPTFDKLIAPSFSSYLSPQQPVSLQIMASCLIDDAIEFGQSSAHKYIPNVANVFMMNSQAEDEVLRQCSMYGLAVATKVAPEIMLNVVPPLVACFVTTIIHPEANEEDNLGITENAVFGLGNLLTFPAYRDAVKAQGNNFPLANLTKLWITKLPLKLDEMESKSSTKNLCDLLERQDEVLFADSNMPCLVDILRVFAESFYSAQAAAQHQSQLGDEDHVVVYAHSNTIQRMERLLPLLKGHPGFAAAYNASAAHVKEALKPFLA